MCADSKTQMATEFNYIVGVIKKIGHIVILAPVAKASFVKKKMTTPIEVSLMQALMAASWARLPAGPASPRISLSER
jgi:hypothetical protein